MLRSGNFPIVFLRVYLSLRSHCVVCGKQAKYSRCRTSYSAAVNWQVGCHKKLNVNLSEPYGTGELYLFSLETVHSTFTSEAMTSLLKACLLFGNVGCCREGKLENSIDDISSKQGGKQQQTKTKSTCADESGSRNLHTKGRG